MWNNLLKGGSRESKYLSKITKVGLLSSLALAFIAVPQTVSAQSSNTTTRDPQIPLVTGNPEFRKVKSDCALRIEWLVNQEPEKTG